MTCLTDDIGTTNQGKKKLGKVRFERGERKIASSYDV